MDARELRNVFGSFVTGVTVVTTLDADGRDHGVTANSFSSVSLDPPLVLWSQAVSARSFPTFRDSSHFIVNILAEHQRDLSQRFASSGADKFEGLAVARRNGGLPALPECCAYVECRKVAMYPGGDHTVYLGEVIGFERNDRRPLAFARGKYMVAFEHELNAAMTHHESSHFAHNEAVRLASAVLPELASRTHSTAGVAVWGNRGATCIRWESDRSGVKPNLRTGIVMSPLTSAVGLLFRAFLPPELTTPVTDEAISICAEQGEDTILLQEEAERELLCIRETELATSLMATQRGHYGFASPVFDGAGHMILALCVVSNKAHEHARVSELKMELQTAARNLSARFGFKPGASGINLEPNTAVATPS